MSRRVHALHKPPLLGYHVMASRAAAPWTPASISGLLLWIDFSDADTLFTDAGSTKVTADGDAIYQANDKSGQGRHLTQPTSGFRPLYKTGIKNGLSCSLFDGSNDFLYLNNDMLRTYPWTIFLVTKIVDAGDTYPLLIGVEKRFALYVEGIAYTHTQHDFLLGGGSSVRMFSTGLVEDNWYSVASIMSDGDCRFYGNGELEVSSSGTPEANTAGHGLYIGGCGYSTTYAHDSYIAEALVYPSVLSDTDRQTVEAYLNAKWNIYEPARTESLEGLLSFEPEEETLWWQGADVQADDILDKVEPQVTLTWWERANQTVDNAIEKAAKYISDKWNKLLQAIKDYFSYDEEE